MQYIRFLLPVYAYPNSIGTQQSHRVNKAEVEIPSVMWSALRLAIVCVYVHILYTPQ